MSTSEGYTCAIILAKPVAFSLANMAYIPVEPKFQHNVEDAALLEMAKNVVVKSSRFLVNKTQAFQSEEHIHEYLEFASVKPMICVYKL